MGMLAYHTSTAFNGFLAQLNDNADDQKALRRLVSRGGDLEAIVDFAQMRGFAIGAEDIRGFLAAANRSEDDELDDDDLSEVAGGVMAPSLLRGLARLFEGLQLPGGVFRPGA